MPLALKELVWQPELSNTEDEKFSKCMTIEDTGILVFSRPKGSWGTRSWGSETKVVKHPRPTEVLFWLNWFADDYWKLKNPELFPEKDEEENGTNEEPKTNGDSTETESNTEDKKESGEKASDAKADEKDSEKESESEDKSDEKEESDEKALEKKEESSSPSKSQEKKKKNNTPIRFVYRYMRVENPGVIFCASNLEDPGDYLHFIFSKMCAQNQKDRNRFKHIGRAMPVHGLCMVNQQYAVENLVNSILDQSINKPENENKTQRFSIMYYDSDTFERDQEQTNVNQQRSYKHDDHRNLGQSHAIQKDAISNVRNCIWAKNPGSVQCLKYQDIQFCIDVIKPFFVIGYLFEFPRLRKYFTYLTPHGLDISGETTDSEDEISDDATLDEEDEIKRKMRVKSRKRRAKQAQLEAEEEERKKVSKMEGADGDGDSKASEKEAPSEESNGVNGHDDKKE